MILRGGASWTSLSGSGPSVLRRDGVPTSEKSHRVSVFDGDPTRLYQLACVYVSFMSNIPVIHITPPFFFAEKSIHYTCFLAYSKYVETYRVIHRKHKKYAFCFLPLCTFHSLCCCRSCGMSSSRRVLWSAREYFFTCSRADFSQYYMLEHSKFLEC